MTVLNPHLSLVRLVVTGNSGGIAYEEEFHNGTNIIRGQNSSGKSTISNLIFYVLGGEYTNWTGAAEECHDVYAEVDINGAHLTLRRTITKARTQPMSIFFGTYDEALESLGVEGWIHLPYAQTEKKESFTNALFNALDFPEVRDDNENKITMNQVLRLLYIDQESPTQNLFKLELFDEPLTRQAISEVLLGVYDDALYADRLAYREAVRKYGQNKSQFDAIRNVITASGKTADTDKIRKEVIKVRKELQEVEEEITKARQKTVINLRATSPIRYQSLSNEYTTTKQRLGHLSTKIKQLEFDIVDSDQFVSSLREKIEALKNSSLTKRILGDAEIKFCPQCLRPIAEHLGPVDGCELCRQPFDEDREKTYAKRLQQEISIQIKESGRLLDEKRATLAKLIAERTIAIERFRHLQKELDAEEKRINVTRDDILDELHVKKGNIESNIIFLNEQIAALESLERLRLELQDLRARIEKLTQSIRLKEETQRRNLQTALRRVEEITLKLLRQDLDRQGDDFLKASSVEIDFANNVFSLDGKFNFSASSNVIFKNCVRYAIFFASLELPFLRFPRFILCDNMEDKGMEEERSQNFQRVIVNMSKASTTDHQIIFTTSKIDPSLNNSELCVGDEYSREHKTLKLE